MYKQPLLILCIFLALGIFLEDYFLLPKLVIYSLVAISFLLLFVFLIPGFVLYKFRSYLLAVCFFTLGIFIHSLSSEKPKMPDLEGKEIIVFKIDKKLNSTEKARRYEITAFSKNVSFRSLLSMPKTNPEFDFSHEYQGEVYIHKIEKPYHDFQFDYEKYLARKGILLQTYLPGKYKIAQKKSVDFSDEIKQKRLNILRKIDSTNLSKKTKEFTKGIILADRTEMDKETVQDFGRSGLMHILAISGSHMVIIFWLILLLLKPIFSGEFRNFSIIFALILIWAFAVFIDYGSSVVRSCIMITVYYIFVLLQRKPDFLHAMALSAFIILLFDSQQLFDVGFQLSYIAVFGIFWLNQPILNYFPKPKNKTQNFLQNIVSVSVSAQIATLPLVIFYFHQYSFISIVANLVVIPFSEILIVFALLMVVFIICSVDFPILNLVYDEVVKFTLKVIHFFADADFAFHEMIAMTLLELFVALIACYFLKFAILKPDVKNFLRVFYFLLIFLVMRFTLNYRANNTSEVIEHQFFKQKIISVKENEQVQFFISENSDVGKIRKYVIEPYLTSRRTKRFDLKILPSKTEKVKIRGKIYDIK